jgi:hypothetical protein
MKEMQIHEASVIIDNGTFYQFETCAGEIYTFKIPNITHECDDK